MKEELFDKTIYVNKQSGFISAPPCLLATTNKHILPPHEEVHSKTFNKFSMVKFHLFYQNTKEIRIDINQITT